MGRDEATRLKKWFFFFLFFSSFLSSFFFFSYSLVSHEGLLSRDEFDICVSGFRISPQGSQIVGEVAGRDDDVRRRPRDRRRVLERLGPKAQIPVHAQSVVLKKAVLGVRGFGVVGSWGGAGIRRN